MVHHFADRQVIEDARRIAQEEEGSSYIPSDPKEFAGRIFHTCYMGTENSSPATRKRAKDLAEAIGRLVRRIRHRSGNTVLIP
jgi:NAD+ synthase (glutamine-hydrolysing)